MVRLVAKEKTNNNNNKITFTTTTTPTTAAFSKYEEMPHSFLDGRWC
jgi:hypothetical protein